MRKVIGISGVVALVATVGAILVTGAAPAYAARTTSHTVVLDQRGAGWVDEVRVPRFDPTLGELRRVGVRVEVAATTDLAVENLAPTPVALSAVAGGAVGFDPTDALAAFGLPAELTATEPRALALDAFDGALDHDGASGTDLRALGTVAVYEGATTDATAFAPFTGDGELSLGVTSRSATAVSGADTGTFDVAGGSTVGVRVVLDYEYLEPKISIAKTPVRPAAAPGGSAGFSIRVTNSGETALGNVYVDDPAAADCSRFLGELPVGAAAEFLCSMAVPVTVGTSTTTPTGTGGDGAGPPVVTNTATVSGQGGGRVVTDTDTAEVLVGTPAVDLAVTPATQTVVRGRDAAFTVTVSNRGTLPLDAVSVTSAVLADCARPVGGLAPGATASFPCTLAAVGADLTAGLDVSAGSGLGPVGARADVAVAVTDPPPVLRPSLTIEAAIDGADADEAPGAPVVAGRAASLSAVVTNTGDDALAGLQVLDSLLGPLGCPVTSLAPGEATTCSAPDRSDRGWSVVRHTTTADATGVATATAVQGTDDTHRYGVRSTVCAADAALLQGLRVRVGDGAWASGLDRITARPGDTITVAWDAFGPTAAGCAVSLAQHATTQQQFDASIEQPLVASASCAGEGCRQVGGGYGLRLVVLPAAAFHQFDLVTGAPLPSVGPAGGFYAGWLTGLVNRLIQAGTSAAR